MHIYTIYVEEWAQFIDRTNGNKTDAACKRNIQKF